jgi:hypothetical protein
MSATIVLPGFGDIDAVRVIASGDLFAVIQDKYPSEAGASGAPGHCVP